MSERGKRLAFLDNFKNAVLLENLKMFYNYCSELHMGQRAFIGRRIMVSFITPAILQHTLNDFNFKTNIKINNEFY